MSIKENTSIAYTMWKMNCPVPIAYRFIKSVLLTVYNHTMFYFRNLINKEK